MNGRITIAYNNFKQAALYSDYLLFADFGKAFAQETAEINDDELSILLSMAPPNEDLIKIMTDIMPKARNIFLSVERTGHKIAEMMDDNFSPDIINPLFEEFKETRKSFNFKLPFSQIKNFDVVGQPPSKPNPRFIQGISSTLIGVNFIDTINTPWRQIIEFPSGMVQSFAFRRNSFSKWFRL